MKDRLHDAAFIRNTVTTAIKCSDLSRAAIAEEMSVLLGKRVTEHTISCFTAESHEQHRWPAEFDLAFCEVVKDWTLLSERVKRAGFRMIDREEERLLEIGRAYVQKAKAEAILATAANPGGAE